MAAINSDLARATSALLAGDYLGAVVNKVTFFSEYTAPTVYDPAAVRTSNMPGAPASQSQGANPWGLLFKPTLVVESPLSPQPYVFAPYGVADPEAHKSKQFALVWGPLAVLGLVGGAAYFLGRAAGKAARR
jgi:hypothetical protein